MTVHNIEYDFTWKHIFLGLTNGYRAPNNVLRTWDDNTNLYVFEGKCK